MNENQIIAAVSAWVEQVVVQHQFCPFAKKELDEKTIRYRVVSDTSFEEGLHALVEECKAVLDGKHVSTSLVIYPNGYESFDQYLDLYDYAVALMEKQGFEGYLQLASFHPSYCFEGEATDDPANYTNRSPYPILHILDEDMLTEVLEHFPNPEIIPERNIEKARELGCAHFEGILESINTNNDC